MIVFTDNQKVYDLSYLRMNSLIFKTVKFPIILDKFIYHNIKINKKAIFKNNKNVTVLFFQLFKYMFIRHAWHPYIGNQSSGIGPRGALQKYDTSRKPEQETKPFEAVAASPPPEKKRKRTIVAG